MSGNFVQRGAPAIVDKAVRAKAAVLSGADLVLELPVTYALSSAEGFAAGGVSILGSFCEYLCFGSETGDAASLMDTAKALLSEEFVPLLREELEKGISFPVARMAALGKMGLNGELLAKPNDILATEYCKAILAQGCAMQPMPICREGSYHDEMPDPENPSATAVRKLMAKGGDWECYVPQKAVEVLGGAALHSMSAGERAVLGKLRTMTDAEFEALPYGSEGLWRKFMHACRSERTLEDILTATKSKRYTRTRLDRMVMCAFLGITKEVLEEKAPYTRCLAFNDVGRGVLKQAKQIGWFVNAGEAVENPYWQLEKGCGDLYGLFAEGAPEAPGVEETYRVYYHREQP
jgi:predicted nucleotidyltransferase